MNLFFKTDADPIFFLFQVNSPIQIVKVLTESFLVESRMVCYLSPAVYRLSFALLKFKCSLPFWPQQSAFLLVLSRGPDAAEVIGSVLSLLGAARLRSPVTWSCAACPGQGPVEVGTLVVARHSAGGLVRGLVHEVVAVSDGSAGRGPRGFVSLRRVSDGRVITEGLGDDAAWRPPSDLAAAGASLEATPLHLALLMQCPNPVISDLIARGPEAAANLDALGRTPLAVSSEVHSSLNARL